eukprot:59230-Chlamydomonas_euryale.AAC.1
MSRSVSTGMSPSPHSDRSRPLHTCGHASALSTSACSSSGSGTSVAPPAENGMRRLVARTVSSKRGRLSGLAAWPSMVTGSMPSSP